MDEQAEAQIMHLLESLEINMSPVVNVRPWYPTRVEGVVTFRVATAGREPYYMSLPQDFTLNAEEPAIAEVKCPTCSAMIGANEMQVHAC